MSEVKSVLTDVVTSVIGNQKANRYLRDPFSCLSHTLGMVLSLIGLIFLIDRSGSDTPAIVASSLFGVCLTALYAASALTHGPHCSDRTLQIFERCDYAAIFLVIAGSYAPVCLLVLPGPLGQGLLIGELVLACLGLLTLFVWSGAPRWLKVSTYLVMGWLFLFAIESITTLLPDEPLRWLLAGAAFYTSGVVFFVTNKPRLWPKYFDAHDLWHVFVLAGSACHFFFVYNLLPIQK